MAQTCLVTGASGELGRVILPRLSAAGWQIRALEHRRPVAPGTWEVVRGDLRSFDRAWLNGVDVVMHLAARGEGRATADLHNALGEGAARSLVEALRGAERVRILLASSIDVYDPTRNIDGLRSGDPTRPITGNGRAKLAAEVVIREHPRWTIARLPMIVGGGDRHSRRFGRLVRLRVFPVTRHRFSALDVRDAADLFVHLARREDTDHAIYTPSDTRVYSWPEVAGHYARQAGVRAWRPVVPAALVRPGLFRLLGNEDGAQYFRHDWYCRPNFPADFRPRYEAFPGAGT